MSLRRVAAAVGLLQLAVGFAMTLAAAVAALYGGKDAGGIALAALVTLAAGAALSRANRVKGGLTHREGYAVVALAWGLAALLGTLPYVLTGTLPPFHALFESMSGITATGATVIGDVESLPKGVLFWRAISQWLGGMGIIVLLVAVLGHLGAGSVRLFSVEAAGPTPERIKPRITQTAKLLWLVYLGLTASHFLLLLAGGLNAFDAIAHAFTTVATGGFSTNNLSVGGFGSAYVEWVTTFFMFCGGVNLALHFRAATGKPVYLKSSEWRVFTVLAVGTGLLIAALRIGGGAETGEAVRQSLFQSVAIITTTGYAAGDYETWGAGAQMLLFMLFLVGGMVGSTSGGVKVQRVMVLAKHAGNQLRRLLHPKAVLFPRIDNKPVNEDILAAVTGFIVLFGAILLLGAVALATMGIDPLTAIAASAATVGNVGPGFGEVGAVDNYGWMPAPALALLSFLMLVGRLEVFTVLLLFHPDMWKGLRVRR
ncbi:MAG: TrkH family potassium uptake protein [Gemmatimonadetes bacterium]|nr:TrkH family potassium uptake protein [Gemmatimonadota bacterium]